MEGAHSVPQLTPELKAHGVDPATFSHVRSRSCCGDSLFRPLKSYLSLHSPESSSFEMEQKRQVAKSTKKKKVISLSASGIVDEEGEGEEEALTRLVAGLGTHVLQWQQARLLISYQRVGAPVGTYDESKFHEEIVVWTRGRGAEAKQCLHTFTEHVFRAAQEKRDESISVFSWVIRDEYWKLSSVKKKRPMKSVVLPVDTKQRVLKDLEEFLSEDTSEWYGAHGIPYKRSYLLYGSPGTGKSSFLSAVASRYERSLCTLQPGHPLMTDSMLADALAEAPKDSILILEDVDALFSSDRKGESKSALTFSGILNALDGLASPHGQLFFLTTNHPERLDAAMMRHGRVDVKVEFPLATEMQVRELFCQFYPAATVDLAAKFTSGLKVEWDVGLSMATLQDFFIQSRQRDAAEAVAFLPEWRQQQQEAKDALAVFEKANKKKAEEGESDSEPEAKVEASSSSTGVPSWMPMILGGVLLFAMMKK